jgi:hypothetical protein
LTHLKCVLPSFFPLPELPEVPDDDDEPPMSEDVPSFFAAWPGEPFTWPGESQLALSQVGGVPELPPMSLEVVVSVVPAVPVELPEQYGSPTSQLHSSGDAGPDDVLEPLPEVSVVVVVVVVADGQPAVPESHSYVVQLPGSGLSVAPVQLSEIGIDESMRSAPCVQRTTDPIGTSDDPHDHAACELAEPSTSSFCAHATATVANVARRKKREL